MLFRSPVVVEPEPFCAPPIEIAVAGIIVRVGSDVSASRIAEIAVAVRDR